MLARQPWLEHHYPTVNAAQAERPSDVKAWLVHRRVIYINVSVPKVPFRDRQAELFERIKILKRRISGNKRQIAQVSRLDGLPTALHWLVPPGDRAPEWKHELHRQLHQPTDQDDDQDVFAPGARLGIKSLRAYGVDPQLCDELQRGERYQLERLPAPFARNNYGS